MDSSDDNAMAGVVQNIPQASASIVSNTSPVSAEHQTTMSAEPPPKEQFSPHFKFQKVEALAEFLKTRFRRQTDITTTKSRVCEVVHADFDSNATASLVGRAIGKAFGKKIHNKGSKIKDVYVHLAEVKDVSLSKAVLPALTIPHYAKDTASFARKRLLSTASANNPVQTTPKSRKTKQPADSSRKITPRKKRTPIHFKDHELRSATGGHVSSGKNPKPTKPMEKKSQRTISAVFDLSHTSTPGRSQPKSAVSGLISPEDTETKRTSLTRSGIESSSTQTAQPKISTGTTLTSPKPALIGAGNFTQIRSKKTYRSDIPVMLTVEEVKVIGQLRNQQVPNFQNLSKQYPALLDAAVVEHTIFIMKSEIQKYVQKADSVMLNSSAEGLHSFSFQRCWDEFQEHLPSLTSVIVGACTRKEQQNLTRTCLQTLTPSITTVIAKCLGLYSKRLSAMKTYYGLMLTNGGLTATCLNRVAHLGDSVTMSTINCKMNDLTKTYANLIKTWDTQVQEYGIVLDNVDIMTKPRREASDKKNVMHHMVQAIVVEERVKKAAQPNASPSKAIGDVLPKDIMPSHTDDSLLQQMMVTRVLRLWSTLPAFQDIPLCLPSEEHSNTSSMSRKTEYVNLGVLVKNENVKEDLLFCLRQYHQLAQGSDGEIQHKLCIGDYLTFERGQQAINSQSDGVTSVDRLEGLLMSMADFHVQLNFLKLIYRLLFTGDSQPSTGTLSHAKDYLNARNVIADPSGRYYDCGALFDKVFNSYLRTVALDELKLTSLERRSHCTADDLKKAAARVVDKYINLSVPNLGEVSKIRCTVCNTKFATERNRRRHHQSKHLDVELTGESEKDAVFSHTCLLLTLGLLRSMHNRAIQLGNGEQIMHLYKYLFIMFKANGAYKYGCGLLETVVQLQVLPQHLVKRLMWNRFFNSYSIADTNIPLDLALEHENRAFKERLKTYRGTYTEAHLARISRGRGVLEKILKRVDCEIGFYVAKRKSKRELTELDISLLVKEYSQASLLNTSSTTERTHSPSLLRLTSNPLAGINGKSLNEWILGRMQLIRVRHYYLQFIQQPASIDDTHGDDDSEIFPHLATSTEMLKLP